MSLAILGLGTAAPESAIDQHGALAIARRLCAGTPEQESWLPGIYAGTGIVTRHMAFGEQVVRDVLDGTQLSGSVFVPGACGENGPSTGERMQYYARVAPPLALRSSARALQVAGVEPSAITHLVTVSCTGFLAPGIDRALIEGLGLPPTVARTHVGFMGCHGALNGLRVADAFTRADPAARVLLCAVEVCSAHYYYGWHGSKLIANALFADGAAALVGGRAGPDSWQLGGNGSCLLPDSAGAMGWTIGDHGFEMTLGREIPGLIARHLRPWLEQWLGGLGLTLEQVRSWAIHPGGPRILSAVGEALALPAAALAPSWEVFASHGNMSSPTILFILERLRLAGAERPCVMLGFGPGLVAEGAVWV